MTGINGSTSERLRTVAAALFWTKGYSATTTRELAAALGVQKATIYHHIQSKEDLLYSLCVESLENIQSAVEEATAEVNDPTERVRALIGAHVSAMLAEKDKHATMLTELRSLTARRRDNVIKLRDDYESLVRSVLADAQEAGALRRDLPVKHLELCLLDLMNWAIFWFRPDHELTPEQLSETFTVLFLEGAADRRTSGKSVNGGSKGMSSGV